MRSPRGTAAARAPPARRGRWRGTSSASYREPAFLDQFAVPLEALLGGALECVEVDMHEPEAHAVAVGPLEVVHQRPGHVAAQVAARAQRTIERDHVAAVVLDPHRIVDGPVLV